jgi:hypothetical protein
MKKRTKVRKRVKWPKQISVGGDIYKVVYSTPKLCKDLRCRGGSYYGCMHRSRQTIYIDKSRPSKGFILFHELLHCAIDSIIPEPELHKEEFVRPLSHVLYNSLRDAGFLKEGM